MEGTKIVHYNILAKRVLEKIYTSTFYIGDSRKTVQGLEEVSAMLQASPDDRDMLLDNIRQATTHVTATLSRIIGRTRCIETIIPDTDDEQYAGTIQDLDQAQIQQPEGAWAIISEPFTLPAKYSGSGDDIQLKSGDAVIATGYYDAMQGAPVSPIQPLSISGSGISGGDLGNEIGGDIGTAKLGGTIWELFPEHPKTGQFEFTILATRNMPVESFKEISAISEDFIVTFACREWLISVKPDEAPAFETRLSELETRLRILGSIRKKPVRKSQYDVIRPQDIIIEE